MTLASLCERFIDKNANISVIELKDGFTEETLFHSEPIWHLEFSKWGLYSVKYIDATHYTTRVYVTAPNDGYKKADF